MISGEPAFRSDHLARIHDPLGIQRGFEPPRRAGRRLLQSARHSGATHQRRQERDQVDPAVVPQLPQRSCPPSASRARLQPRQLHAHPGVTRCSGAVVADDASEKLIKIGANIVRHGHYVTFQMAEVAIPRDLFADIPRRIDRLRPPPSAPDDIKAQACDVWRRAHRALGYPVVRSPTRPNSRTRGDKAEPRRVGPHASSELGFARCVEKPPADDAEL